MTKNKPIGKIEGDADYIKIVQYKPVVTFRRRNGKIRMILEESGMILARVKSIEEKK